MIYTYIQLRAYVCTDKSIIFLCGLKYIGQVIIHGPHRQCRIVLPGVAKFGSMDREDTIEIRVFFQCQNPDGVFCVFIRGGRGHATCLFNIRHFTPVIEMAAAGAPQFVGVDTIMRCPRNNAHTYIACTLFQLQFQTSNFSLFEFYHRISINSYMSR